MALHKKRKSHSQPRLLKKLKYHPREWVDLFRSFLLPNETSSGESGIPHHGGVWMVQVFSTERDIFREIRHHGRGRMLKVLSTETDIYKESRIPSMDSVWMVQVFFTDLYLFRE